MAGEGSLTVYVAFRPHVATKVSQTGTLSPNYFGYPWKYIPFTSTAEHAVEAILHSTQGAPEVADNDVFWHVLEVVFTPAQVSMSFQDGTLSHNRSNQIPGYRYHCSMQKPLKLSSVAFNWFEAISTPIGFQSWARKALRANCDTIYNGTCKQCGAQGQTWRSKKHGQTATQEWIGYCAVCWNARIQQGWTDSMAGASSILNDDAVMMSR